MVIRGRRAQRRGVVPSSRGYISVELTGMVMLIAVTILLLWQSVLAGYTLLLASQAADRSARTAATHLPDPDAAALGEDAGHDGLPSAWQSDSEVEVSISVGGDRARAQVGLQVPLVLPGWLGTPLTVTASSAASP